MSYKLSVVFSLHAAFFFGTLAPFSRASDNPIAIACLRLVTLPPLPPLPERKVPFFFRRMALATVLPAALPYLALDFFLPAIELLLHFPFRVETSIRGCQKCAGSSASTRGANAVLNPLSCLFWSPHVDYPILFSTQLVIVDEKFFELAQKLLA